MAPNDGETINNHSSNTSSVFFCPQAPDLTWDLDNTTFAWILVGNIIFLSPTTILLNLLAIVAIVKRKELRKLSNILLSSITVADLLVGAIGMPLSALVDVLILSRVSFEHVCTLDLANGTFMCFLSKCILYHLIAIAWERYVAIRKCTDYKSIVTKSLVIKLAIIAWLLALFTEVPALIMAAAGVDHRFVENWHIVENVVAAVCLIVITYFYLMVYLGVRKRMKIRTSPSADQKLEYKVAKMTGFPTAALLFSFTPAIASLVLSDVFPILQRNWAFRLSETLLQLHSLATPIMYWYTDRRFRNAVLVLLRMRKPQATHPAIPAIVPRRRDWFESVELHHMAIEESPPRLARPDFCDTDRGLDYAHPFGVPHTIDECSGSSDGSQLQQPSIVITTAMIHTERGGRRKAKGSKSVAAKDAKGAQGTVQLIRNKSRSTSWHAGFSVKYSDHGQKLQHRKTSLRRTKTAPGGFIATN